MNGVSAAALGLRETTRRVDLGVNRGVAPGWNAAARIATGDVLVFANDDVVLGPGSLALLHDTLARHTEAGVVGPLGSNWDIAAARHLGWVDPQGLATGAIERCDVVSGFLFAARSETFATLGGFDEYYAPCSFEEVDLCTAARARLGLGCFAVAGVHFEHTWGISAHAPPWRRVRFNGRSETLRSIHRRNRRHFLAKWAGVAPAATGSPS